MSKVISYTKLTPTLFLSECTDGFWLWDEDSKRNLSMKAKTAQDALVEALDIALERCARFEKAYAELSKKVNAFVFQFKDDEKPWEC